EQRTENPRVTGSIPVLGIFYWKNCCDHRGSFFHVKRRKGVPFLRMKEKFFPISLIAITTRFRSRKPNGRSQWQYVIERVLLKMLL
ncbi:MAG TPA: hypothetical protein H9956_05260, partial [Candidatus Eisenbergiella pullicola]|nr:hypothetical protein [Candidatus Eisenbergiella pullicola]